jgi:hypothetical protein
MEKSYQNISYFFIGILICALIGFHFTYTIKFPNFEGLSNAHHFHGFMLMSWFAMLIVQPFLIRFKKIEWHRQLGKISYLQIPLLLFSIFLVTKVAFFRNITQMPRPVAIGNLTLDIPAIFAFGIFYILAMVNKQNTSSHMRYMIATSFLMIGPGLGRALIIFGGIPFPVAVNFVQYVAEFIALIFLAFDYFNGHPIKPYSIVLGVLIACHLCWGFQMSGWWQGFGEWFVRVFF